MFTRRSVSHRYSNTALNRAPQPLHWQYPSRVPSPLLRLDRVMMFVPLHDGHRGSWKKT